MLKVFFYFSILRSGIRPLVKDPNKTDTQSLVRNHVVHVSDGNLITIAGGKWTTYRTMAKETIDEACKASNLEPKNDSRTDGLLLEGGHNWTPTMYIRLDINIVLNIGHYKGDPLKGPPTHCKGPYSNEVD